jgi:DNA polymerase III subunit delta
LAKAQLPSVSECIKSVRSGAVLPVYFLCGDDSYLIDIAAAEIARAADKYIQSDFDKEAYRGGEEKNLSDILSSASAFPFSSDKKIITIKDFDKFRDKKNLNEYIKSPPDFSVLLIIHNGQISSAASEPYKSLVQKGYLFEAKELKGRNLIQWIIEYTKEKEKFIASENAQILVEIVGENRVILEDQINKMITFLGERREITQQEITALAAETKEYSIFDLQNALGKKNHSEALKYGLNLVEKGKEPVFILFMLTKYFSVLSRMGELIQQNLNSAAAAKELGIAEWTYRDYVSARKLYSENQLEKIAKALLKADISVKTSSMDDKTLISVLLGEILSS